MATPFSFRLYRGDTAALSVAVKKPDDTDYDITGCELFFTAKYDRDMPDSEAQIKKDSVEGGIGIIDAVSGEAVIILDPDDTKDLETGVPYFCDVQVKTSLGAIHTAAIGRILLLDDATRRTV
jgi:hypothetical protein